MTEPTNDQVKAAAIVLVDSLRQEFMRRQGYGPDMIKLFTSVLAGTPHDTSQVATTEQPDNSGYGILSALLGTAAKAATMK